MGKKGKWFGAVKKVFSPEPKEKKGEEHKNEKLKKAVSFPASTSENRNASCGAPPLPLPPPVPVVDVEPIERAEDEQDEAVHPVEIIDAEASAVAVEVMPDDVAHTVVNTPRVQKKLSEEDAAIIIQTTFRGHQARRALRALKGLVRLKSLVEGDAAKRQVTTTLRCMQTLSRVQSQIQSRRIQLTEEKLALQRLKREQELEALKASMGDEWVDSVQTKEQVDANLMSKHEAAIRRERALAYAFSRQRKNSLKSGYPLFTDLNNPHWNWSCLDRWTESAAPSEKESFNDQASVKSASFNVGGEITSAFARRDLNTERPTSGSKKTTRSSIHNAPPMPPPKASPTRRSLKLESNSGGQIPLEDDDSRSVMSSRSEVNRRHSMPSSSMRGDENLPNSPTTPNFMNPTKSARAKSRFHSPSSDIPETPDRISVSSSAKKRLSLSTTDKHGAALPGPRRHSGPPKVNINKNSVVSSPKATEAV